MARRRTIDVDEPAVDLRGRASQRPIGLYEHAIEPPDVGIADRYEWPAPVRTHEATDTHDHDLSARGLATDSGECGRDGVFHDRDAPVRERSQGAVGAAVSVAERLNTARTDDAAPRMSLPPMLTVTSCASDGTDRTWGGLYPPLVCCPTR